MTEACIRLLFNILLIGPAVVKNGLCNSSDYSTGKALLLVVFLH